MAVSDSAVKRIATMREKQGSPNLMLRVTVLGGGCSGFKYQLDFDDKTAADDVTFRGVVVTDESSLPFLQNALVDYEQNLMGSAFKIKNPNAASSCGCGKSFSTKM
jgi:iron-sulfur cluster insertion protein